MSKREEALRAAGFEIEGTGGGCTAWALQTKDGGYIWITDANDPSHHIGDDAPIAIGVYDRDGEIILQACESSYLCNWGEGYDNPEPAQVSLDFFCEDNGYTAEARERVIAMNVGDTIDLTDLSGVHTVKRES